MRTDHGLSRYKSKTDPCRCPECRAAANANGKAHKARLVESVGGPPTVASHRRWALTEKGEAALSGAVPPVGAVQVPVPSPAELAQIAAQNRAALTALKQNGAVA